MIFYFNTDGKIVDEAHINKRYKTWRGKMLQITSRMITHPSKKVKEIVDWLKKNDLKVDVRKIEFVSKEHWQLIPTSKETFFRIEFAKASDAVLFKMRWA